MRNFLKELGGAVVPYAAHVKAAMKLAALLAAAKLRANFRKWNRGETGKTGDDNSEKR